VERSGGVGVEDLAVAEVTKVAVFGHDELRGSEYAEGEKTEVA
jgi:hypothetical protein